MKKLLVFVLVAGVAGAWALLGARPSHAVSAVADWSPKPELVLVPAGVFQMGDMGLSRSMPEHQVSLSADFQIGKFEVSNQEYAEMLTYALSKGYLDKEALSETAKKREARGVSKSPQKYQDVFDEHSQIRYENGVFRAQQGKERFPVVEVTWHGAAFYCNMLSEKEGLSPLYNLDDWSCQVYGKSGYRLPTEAEWERAATFDDGRAFPWGLAGVDDTYANIKHKVKNPVDVDTTAAGAFSPKGDSKLGICDLAGNVAEWCNDWYNDVYPGTGTTTRTDPVGPGQVLFFNLPVFKEFRAARVVRGGSFLLDPGYRKEMGPPFIMDTVMHSEVYRNTFRSFDFLSRQVIGFRVAKITAGKRTKAAFSAPQ